MPQPLNLYPAPSVAPQSNIGKPKLSVCCNNDQVIVTWKYAAPILNCIGFAVYRKLIENARSGVLFLMFNPGQKNTFFNYIQDVQSRKPNLFVHGVINQDPGATIKNPLIFFHRGQKVEADWKAILPRTIDSDFAFWYKEISAGMVTIHSKIVVIDPFGEHPFVAFGSHNFGPKASLTNDENLLIINDVSVARQYAVNIMAVYDHYRWRYSLFNQNTDYQGLTRDREWMSDYMDNTSRMKELDFWL